MSNFAYLRISKDTQDIENQKFGILDYCNQKNMLPVSIVEDKESRSISWRNRGIGKILQTAKKGDVIIRIGGSPLQVLEILEEAAKKEISIHIVKNQIVMNESLQSTIIATVLGLAAQIEREFISIRTKEALAKRKSEGMKLGRPKGEAKNLKLDIHKDKILEYLRKKVSKASISKIIECSPSTLYAWLKRHNIKE